MSGAPSPSGGRHREKSDPNLPLIQPKVAASFLKQPHSFRPIAAAEPASGSPLAGS
jgi:hypothetical protein